MASKKVKAAASLITASCGVAWLMYYRSTEHLAGNKAKSWIYSRLQIDGSFDRDEMREWLVRSKFVTSAKEAERAIREVIENITPPKNKPK